MGAAPLLVHDVIGLNPRSLKWVEGLARGWWANWKRKGHMEEQPDHPEIETPPQPAPTVRVPRPLGPRHTIDVVNLTLGAGPGADVAQRAAQAGLSTGFRKLGARKPGSVSFLRLPERKR
jgi:hypothetical protein